MAIRDLAIFDDTCVIDDDFRIDGWNAQSVLTQSDEWERYLKEDRFSCAKKENYLESMRKIKNEIYNKKYGLFLRVAFIQPKPLKIRIILEQKIYLH